MPTDWSLILNVFLLVGVIVAIGRLMNARRTNMQSRRYKPATAKPEPHLYDKSFIPDDIVAVRKVVVDNVLSTVSAPNIATHKITRNASEPRLMAQDDSIGELAVQPKKVAARAPLMMFLSAKEQRHFAGYELLQILLACGLRFGEGQLFHRHQQINGEGDVVCSLALATASGVFDLHQMGALQTKGLCLFMHLSQDASLNAERFEIMLTTAKQLSQHLDACLLDEQRNPLQAEGIARYQRTLGIVPEEAELISA